MKDQLTQEILHGWLLVSGEDYDYSLSLLSFLSTIYYQEMYSKVSLNSQSHLHHLTSLISTLMSTTRQRSGGSLLGQ